MTTIKPLFLVPESSQRTISTSTDSVCRIEQQRTAWPSLPPLVQVVDGYHLHWKAEEVRGDADILVAPTEGSGRWVRPVKPQQPGLNRAMRRRLKGGK
jgi:hypothetical protein